MLPTRNQNASIRPGIGWQRWTPAALPLLARRARFKVDLPQTASPAQRRLIDETVRSVRAVHRLCRTPRRIDRAGDVSARWAAAAAARIEQLERVVARLSQGGVWLWWRHGADELELQFMRMRR